MKTKYPRTFHLPFSQGVSSDDKVQKDLSSFQGKEVVVTVKMDGENTTLYSDAWHARSLDSKHHSSRDWLAAFHASVAHNIPVGWRICGENLYAKHSISYNELQSYFMGFSAWDEYNCSLSWDDTLLLFEDIGITPVETIYRGVFDEKLIRSLAKNFDTSTNEGFVVRLAERFNYSDFNKSVVKWVRSGHVGTSEHWMHQAIVPNKVEIKPHQVNFKE